MRYLTGLLVAAAGSTMLTGCIATQSQLKHASDQQTLALNSERAERIASDSALAQQLGMVRGDVQSLRADLEKMRADYGAKITALEDGLHFAMPVNFAFDDAAIRDQDHAQLDRFAHVVETYYPGSKVTVEGFADPAGTQRYNLMLSARRANNVRSYLMSQGLTGNPIETVGYGESRLVTPGASHDEPGAELNRRVVFVIESRGQTTVAMNSPEHQ